MARTKSVAKAKKKLGGTKTPDGHRTEKAAEVSDVAERLRTASAVFLTEYRGLTVTELKDLRRALAKNQTDYKISKNTLVRIAAKQAEIDGGIEGMLEGPVALAFVAGDPIVAAKDLADFAKKAPALVVKGAIYEGTLFDAAGAKRLAALESREVMLSKAAGMFITPIQQTANVFAAGLNQFGAVLAQLKDKLAASEAAA